MPDRKRIAVIVEWEGMCDEWSWVSRLGEAFEKDRGRDTNCRVTRMIPLTDFGQTEVLSDDELRDSILRIEGERDEPDSATEIREVSDYYRDSEGRWIPGGGRDA